MTADLSISTTTGRGCDAQKVWERVWTHEPSVAKDDLLLARERLSPRWGMIVERLERTFGTIHELHTVELGSGRGDVSVLLAERGARVTLLDASDKALEQARQRFDRLGLGAALEQEDIFEVGRTWRGRFDVSLSSGVIEHFVGDDRTRILRAHHDVIRPGGLSVVSVPHAHCPPYRLWKTYLELRGWWPYGMEIPYTKREIIRRAREAGFDRIEASCMEFRQSLANHLIKPVAGRGPDWYGRRSWLDEWMGLVLVLFARRKGDQRSVAFDDGCPG